MAILDTMTPPPIPPRWSSSRISNTISSTGQDTTAPALPKRAENRITSGRVSSHSSSADESYDDSAAEEKVRLAPNMAVITKAIREKKARPVMLDERYMSSEEALSLSPPGEDLELTDEFDEDEEETYDVDDLLDNIFEDEEFEEVEAQEVVIESPKKFRSYADFAVALSITVIGRAKLIDLNPFSLSPNTTTSDDADDEAEQLRRASKASKRDVPFIAIPKRLRPLSIIKPVEIRADGSQSSISPDFWTAVPMFGEAIISPVGQQQVRPVAVEVAVAVAPAMSRATTTITDFSTSTEEEEGSTSPSTVSSSILNSPCETATTTSSVMGDSPVLPQRRPSLMSLHHNSPMETATSKPTASTSLFKSLGSKFTTTLSRKPKIESLLEASNGLAGSTMSSGQPSFPSRANSIAHRRRGSLNLLSSVGTGVAAGRTSSYSHTTGTPAIGRPKLQARGASEREPIFQLPPSPDSEEFDVHVHADEAVRAVSKQLTRRPVGSALGEGKRRSLLGVVRR